MDEANSERWRGRVDTRLDNTEAEVAKVDAKHEKLAIKLELTNLEVKGVATKIGTWATAGAILGGGLVSMVIKIFFDK